MTFRTKSTEDITGLQLLQTIFIAGSLPVDYNIATVALLYAFPAKQYLQSKELIIL